MRDLILVEYDVVLAVRTVGTYLARWGCTSKRPQRHARDQDPEEVQEWLETTYPELEKQVKGYLIESVLARNGLSVGYRAEQLALKRTVALNIMLAGEHDSVEQRVRFRIEAAAMARFQRANIVQIQEVGEFNGVPYYALEYVETVAQGGTPRGLAHTGARSREDGGNSVTHDATGPQP